MLHQNNINTLRPRQNGRHFPDIFKCILNENVWISMKISLKFFPKGPKTNVSSGDVPAPDNIKLGRC